MGEARFWQRREEKMRGMDTRKRSRVGVVEKPSREEGIPIIESFIASDRRRGLSCYKTNPPTPP